MAGVALREGLDAHLVGHERDAVVIGQRPVRAAGEGHGQGQSRVAVGTFEVRDVGLGETFGGERPFGGIPVEVELGGDLRLELLERAGELGRVVVDEGGERRHRRVVEGLRCGGWRIAAEEQHERRGFTHGQLPWEGGRPRGGRDRGDRKDARGRERMNGA